MLFIVYTTREHQKTAKYVDLKKGKGSTFIRKPLHAKTNHSLDLKRQQQLYSIILQ